MVKLNGKKFAENDKEFVNSLFDKDGTCEGYVKVNKKTVSILDMQKNKVGVIANRVLGKASKQDNGKYWYSYAIPSIVGEYASYKDMNEDIDKVYNQFNLKA